MSIETSLDLISQLQLHMLEDLSFSSPSIIQHIEQVIASGGVPPPPSGVPHAPRSPQELKLRAFNQTLTQLELLLEVKEKMLEIGNVEPEIAKQFKEDIVEIKKKIEKVKGVENDIHV